MMNIRTFREKNLQRALARVRDELGPDAAILETKSVGGRWFGWMGSPSIEVVASSSVKIPSRLAGLEDRLKLAPDHPSPHPSHLDRQHPKEADQESTAMRSSGSVEQQETNRSETFKQYSNAPINRIQSPVKRQTDQLESLTGHQLRMASTAREPSHDDRFAHCESLMREMLGAGMDPMWARHLLQIAQESLSIEQWQDPLYVRGRVTHWVQSQLPIAPPIQAPNRERPYVIAMVGPTGVGKTTTLAKLAAGFTLEEKLQVGLITIDTFRIGAVEQLRKYAEIMSLPMAVVESAEEMKLAVQRLSHCRLLFIDTAGRTPRDAEQLDVLRSLLQAAQPDETHLVLSATTSVGSCQDAMHRYSVVQPNRMVLTKLDEVRGLGELFPMLRQATVPLSYVTTGQNVPEDIEAAQQTRLAAFMLGHCSLA